MPGITEQLVIESPTFFAFAEKKLLGCLLGGVNSPRDIPRLIEPVAGRAARPRGPGHRSPSADRDQRGRRRPPRRSRHPHGDLAVSDAMPSEAPTASASRRAEATRKVGARWRRVLVVVLAVLTCLSILASTVGVWAHRTLLNTDSWVNAVGPLAEQPRDHRRGGQAAHRRAHADDRLARSWPRTRCPAQAQVLVAPLSEAVGQFVQRAVGELLQTEQFQEFWIEANRRVHALVVKVLRGETTRWSHRQRHGAAQPAAADRRARSGSSSRRHRGCSATARPCPTSRSTRRSTRPRPSCRPRRSAPCPTDFGVVTVFESDKLKAAQDAVSLVRPGW